MFVFKFRSVKDFLLLSSVITRKRKRIQIYNIPISSSHFRKIKHSRNQSEFTFLQYTAHINIIYSHSNTCLQMYDVYMHQHYYMLRKQFNIADWF